MIKNNFIEKIENFEELKDFCWGDSLDILKNLEELHLQDDFIDLLNFEILGRKQTTEKQLVDFLFDCKEFVKSNLNVDL